MEGFLKARKGLRLRGYVGTSEGAAVSVVVVALGSMEDVFDAICTGSAADCMAPVMVEGGKRVKKRRSLGWRSWARRMCFCVAAMLGVYVRLSVVYPRLFGDFNIDARTLGSLARDGPTLAPGPTARVRRSCLKPQGVWRELHHHHQTATPNLAITKIRNICFNPRIIPSTSTPTLQLTNSGTYTDTPPTVSLDFGDYIEPDTSSTMGSPFSISTHLQH